MTIIKQDGTVENLGTKKIISDTVQITAKDEQEKQWFHFKTNIANGYIKNLVSSNTFKVS